MTKHSPPARCSSAPPSSTISAPPCARPRRCGRRRAEPAPRPDPARASRPSPRREPVQPRPARRRAAGSRPRPDRRDRRDRPRRLAERGFIVPDGAGQRPRRGVPAGQAPAARRHRRGSRRRRQAPRRPGLLGPARRSGKTFCAINLALQPRRRAATSRCCSSTATSSSPKCSPLLGIERAAPASSTRSPIRRRDPEALVIRTDVPGLSVLPAGRKDQ